MKNLKRRMTLAEIKLELATLEIQAAIKLAHDLDQLGTVNNLLKILDLNEKTMQSLRNASV